MIARTMTVAVAVAGLAGTFGAMGNPAVAHADTMDNTFIQLLQNEGISDHTSTAHAIEAGHMVCQKLDQGLTPNQVADDVLNSSSMPAYHSGYFVGAAIEIYCPQYEPEEAKT